jgi:cytochrome c-type protein NapC
MSNEKVANHETFDGRARRPLRKLFADVWTFFSRPTPLFSVAVLVVTGMVIGVLGWGAFNWSMDLTNTETFCNTCHEMEHNVFREFKGTVHDANASGVRATCPDCHVPRPWVHKVARKIQASNELYHHFLGTIDTREKYEQRRLDLAKRVWIVMKETDSRECRNCHGFDGMDVSLQPARARDDHLRAIDDGRTCIDCHKGIAHELPEGALEAERELNEQWQKK